MMNCKADSAESIPPMPSIGKPGSLLPIADTARKPIGLVALPETPPYVVCFSRPKLKKRINFKKKKRTFFYFIYDYVPIEYQSALNIQY